MNNRSHLSHPGYPYLHNRYHPNNQGFPTDRNASSEGNSNHTGAVFAPGYLMAVQDDTYMPKSQNTKFQFAYAHDPRVVPHETIDDPLTDLLKTEPRFKLGLEPSPYSDLGTQDLSDDKIRNEGKGKQEYQPATTGYEKSHMPAGYPLPPAFPRENGCAPTLLRSTDQQITNLSGQIHPAKQSVPASYNADVQRVGTEGSQNSYNVTIGGIHKDESFLICQGELENQNNQKPIAHETEPLYYPQEPTLIQSLTDERGNHYSAISISTDTMPHQNGPASSDPFHGGCLFTPTHEASFSPPTLQDIDPSHTEQPKPNRIASVKVSSDTIPTYFNHAESRISSKPNGPNGMPGFTFNSLQ